MAFGSGRGFRFHPTDEELVDHYLRLKMSGYDHRVGHIIAELNICDFEPWELPDHSAIQSEDQVWYFFSPRTCKYANSQRIRRTTTGGYWKVTGKDYKVQMEESKEEIAIKRILVFYAGRVPNGVRTSWVMHEYSPTFNVPNQRDYVVCKIKRNDDAVEEGESSSNVPSNNSNNQSQYQYHQGHNNSYEEDLQMQTDLNSFEGYNEMDYNLSAALPTSQMPNYEYDGSGGAYAGGSGYSGPGYNTYYGNGYPHNYN